MAEIAKSQRGQPGGPSSGHPGTLVPVGAVKAPDPIGAEHQGVRFTGEAVLVQMPLDDLRNQTRHRLCAASGSRFGLGLVTADLGQRLRGPAVGDRRCRLSHA
jgi:hypothetical protein